MLILGILLIPLFSCELHPRARSLLLITLDTTRADHLGVYGDENAKTPNEDALAHRGTRYMRAYAAIPETLPSHTSIMTGLYPPSHGVLVNLSNRVPDEVTTLAEILKSHGFHTAAVVSAVVLDHRYGLDQGFETYLDPGREGGGETIPAEVVTKRALEVAGKWKPGDRYFLWAHYYDAHSPYRPPAGYRPPGDQPFDSPALYDGEISYADHWVGRLLAGLRKKKLLTKKTLVILVGDHGESLGDHGETYHTLFVYDSTIHVPLILAGPGIPIDRRIHSVVSSIDIFATALEKLGIEYSGKTSSVPLPTEKATPGSAAASRVVYSESAAPALRFGWAPLQAVRDADWLYIRAPRQELYHYPSGTSEVPATTADNVATRDHHDLHAQERLLVKAIDDMPKPAATAQASKPKGGVSKQLEALGYLAASHALTPSSKEGADPKDMVEVAEAYELAHLARRLGKLGTARKLLQFATSVDPKNPGGWLELGKVELDAGESLPAIKAIHKTLEIRPKSWEAWTDLGRAEEQLGHLKESADDFNKAMNLTDFPAQVWGLIAQLRLRGKDWIGAADACRQILAIDPTSSNAKRLLERLEKRGLTGPTAESGGTASDSPDKPAPSPH